MRCHPSIVRRHQSAAAAAASGDLVTGNDDDADGPTMNERESAFVGKFTIQKFSRVKVRDPYQRLGIDVEASSEEVSRAFNFLIREHAGDERGLESIEAAYDRIISDRLTSRKAAKGLKRLKKLGGKSAADDSDYNPKFVQRVKDMFAKPDQVTLIRRSVLYVIIAGWAIAAPASSGPAFQMAVAFGTCVYFLNEKRGGKGTLGKSFRDSFIALLMSWILGSIVPVYIPLFPQAFSPELILALFSFLSLWVTCTFLK
jgi:hypothetical protein